MRKKMVGLPEGAGNILAGYSARVEGGVIHISPSPSRFLVFTHFRSGKLGEVKVALSPTTKVVWRESEHLGGVHYVALLLEGEKGGRQYYLPTGEIEPPLE